MDTKAVFKIENCFKLLRWNENKQDFSEPMISIGNANAFYAMKFEGYLVWSDFMK